MRGKYYIKIADNVKMLEITGKHGALYHVDMGLDVRIDV
jgi:hypothetical protein